MSAITVPPDESTLVIAPPPGCTGKVVEGCFSNTDGGPIINHGGMRERDACPWCGDR